MNGNWRNRIGFIILLAAVAFITWLITSRGMAAQPELPEGVTLDPRSWFATTAALGAVVTLVIQWVKPHVSFLKGVVVKIASVVLAVALAVTAELIAPDLIDGNVVNAVSFGVLAGIGASGLKDYLKSLGGGSGGQTAPGAGNLPS